MLFASQHNIASFRTAAQDTEKRVDGVTLSVCLQHAVDARWPCGRHFFASLDGQMLHIILDQYSVRRNVLIIDGLGNSLCRPRAIVSSAWGRLGRGEL